jgi:SMI1 / KNR4 family (SUKH-1)
MSTLTLTARALAPEMFRVRARYWIIASESLRNVLLAWQLSVPLHVPEPGASANDVTEAQRLLGRPLPQDAEELYLAVGGGSFVDGNFNLYPLSAPRSDGTSLTLTTASDLLRSWEWPIPDELVVLGDNGSDDSFGLWLPRSGDARPVVLQIGEIFEDACLAVVGDDLSSFLVGWIAYYLLLLGDETDTRKAVAALGVPEGLRSLDESGSADEFFALLNWANPGLPDARPDPYARGMTAAEVEEFARMPSGST